MEPWHYDPSADLDPALLERLDAFPRKPNVFVSAARALAALVVRGWLRFFHRFTIVGRENLPADGSFVLIANHASHLDALCLLAAIPVGRLDNAFPAAARDYFCTSPSIGFLAAVALNVVPFDRHHAPMRCLSVCAYLLRISGNILIMFPEGTRSGGSAPREFKPGVALLAAGRELPVVPCHLSGTHAALPKGAWFPRPAKLRLTIGAPLGYAHLPATKAAAKQICGELRDAVMSLGGVLGDAENLGPVVSFVDRMRPCSAAGSRLTHSLADQQ